MGTSFPSGIEIKGLKMESGYAVEAEPVAKQSKKKPNFIKRWMLNLLKDAVENERQVGYATNQIISARNHTLSIGSHNIDQPERAIHFTVYVANGGRIVETRKVDRKTDRSTNGLYIITNDQEFGREIDKIMTMEALK